MAWVVLLAVNVLCPVIAQAGCSHPWVQRAGISASLFDLGLLESGVNSAHPKALSGGSSNRRDPCAGGACSRSPELPPRSAVRISPTSEQWCELPAEWARLASLFASHFA